MDISKKISFIGAGSIGTALANVIASTKRTAVVLHSVEDDVVASIRSANMNRKYFPSVRLEESIHATTDLRDLEGSELIFLAIPSIVLMEYMESIRGSIPQQAYLVNLAKGFGKDRNTILSCLAGSFPNPLATMKGPTFAREIINRMPTAFTVGTKDDRISGALRRLFEGTSVYLDYSHDAEGVEILSILKNIYAIALGIVDAQFNSPNIRFLVLTKAFREMHSILCRFGGEESTIFLYCGYGDFTLTALNDLSRNRTLGLLIGKGFFTKPVSHELVLEGQVAVNIFYEKISAEKDFQKKYPILSELYRVMNHDHDLSLFIKTVLES